MNISYYTNVLNRGVVPAREESNHAKSSRSAQIQIRWKIEQPTDWRKLSLGKSTVTDYLERFKRSGLKWPLQNEMVDVSLERLLFLYSEDQPCENRPMPDWAYIHRELGT